jgi:hypothetical protein
MPWEPYEDYVSRTTETGSASAKTVYLEEIPNGFSLSGATITACIYTSALGDYTTAKYINLGIERNGVKHYVMGRDITTNQLVIRNDANLIVPGGWRPFAEFEGTATTVTYEVSVFGVLHHSGQTTK